MMAIETSKDLKRSEVAWRMVPSGSTALLEDFTSELQQESACDFRRLCYFGICGTPLRVSKDVATYHGLSIGWDLSNVVFMSASDHIEYVEAMEHDIVVKMPPKRRYNVELEIKNIRKAQPIVIEP
jgi:hypothetical protein